MSLLFDDNLKIEVVPSVEIIANTDFEKAIYDLDTEIDLLSSHADLLDYIVAASSGVICGMLDILTELMQSINTGKAQLPDFQRGWVWDDDRIKSLIASVTCGFPVGAAMFLEYGNTDIRFKYRVIEGSPAFNIVPDELILDGQQRLTSLYSSLYNQKPVKTRTEKNKDKDIFRYYYIDIKKAIDEDVDRIDAIISVPAETKKITSEFGRNVILDLSTQDMEFEQHIFPLNIILDFVKSQDWQNKYYAYFNYDPTVIQQFTKFNNEIVIPTMQYKMPVIKLNNDALKNRKR